MVSPEQVGRETEAWLSGLINLERSPGRRRLDLSPVRALLDRVGNPERGLPVLHVAGSKGKGSTALFAEALLRAAGQRVATYTSPHLERWTERFRIDGKEVSESQLGQVLARLRPHVEDLRRAGPDLAPSFFDVTTAAGLMLFAEAEVDLAILEVGLGGRLDSTNVCEPRVTAVTSIELEHTAILGSTLEAIAGEKAGILKAGVPVVMAALPEPAAAVVSRRARELGAPLASLGRDFTVQVEQREADALRLRVRDGDFQLSARLATPALHQADNAALALACVRRLGSVSDDRLAELAPAALAGVCLPGRVEFLSRRPWIVVDSAHTAASARALAEVLARLPRRRAQLVLSVSTGKDLAALCEALAPQADVFTLTRAEAQRSLDPREVAAALRATAPSASLRVVPNPQLALRAARAELAPDDLLCATGSVYLAGIARRILAVEPTAVRVSRRAGPRGGPEDRPVRGPDRGP